MPTLASGSIPSKIAEARIIRPLTELPTGRPELRNSANEPAFSSKSAARWPVVQA
jgi:hypothetical protein